MIIVLIGVIGIGNISLSAATMHNYQQRENIPPLIETKWVQEAPANKKVNELIGWEYAGCTPIAMAQIMKYYNYPSTALVDGKYTYDGQDYTYDMTSVPFIWDKMINDYQNCDYATDQGDAIAHLVFAITTTIPMSHSLLPYEITGPVPASIALSFRDFFGYDSGIRHLDHTFFDDETWENIIYHEISEGRPVLMDGNSIYGMGHSFIIDGYKDGYFHINWGWGGDQEAYFKLDTFLPMEESMGYGTFLFNQEITIGIQPPGVSKNYNPYVDIDPTLRLESDFGDTFTYTTECSYPIDVELGVKIVSSAGDTVFFSTDIVQLQDSYPHILSWNKNAVNGLSDGDYIVTPVYKYGDYSDWIELPVCRYNVSYMNLCVTGEQYRYSSGHNSLFNAEIVQFTPQDTVYSHTTSCFCIQMINYGDIPFGGYVQAKAYDENGVIVPYVIGFNYGSHHILDNPPIEREVFINLDPGTYYLEFEDLWGKKLSGRFKLEVCDKSSAVESIDRDPINVYVENSNIRVSGSHDNIIVCDMSGTALSGHCTSDGWIFESKHSGVYIVKGTGFVKKVIVP